MARRRQGGKKRGSLVGTLVFALALLLMWLGSELGLVSWGGGGPGGGVFYGLRYDEFLAPLIKVVQRQGERIQALEEALRGLFPPAASMAAGGNGK